MSREARNDDQIETMTLLGTAHRVVLERADGSRYHAFSVDEGGDTAAMLEFFAIYEERRPR